MTDKTEVVKETLQAANDASSRASTIWLAFLGLLAYLFVALASVSHKDLLLNSAVNLPIVDVKLPLFSFFLFGPYLLVLVHFGLLMQHVTLSQKLAAFDEAIKGLVRTRGRRKEAQKEKALAHPARLRLHGYSITQYIAGPPNSGVVKAGQWLMGWLTLTLLPLVILLYFQVQFLPYHSDLVTGLHRAAIILDLIVLVLVGVFIDYPVNSFKIAFAHNLKLRRARLALTTLATVFILLVSLGVATIPDRSNEKFIVSFDILVIDGVFWPTAYFFEGEDDPIRGKEVNWFSRNLIVTDTDLVPDKVWEPDERSFSLRERDLRYAQLDRSDLHRVDLFGADLSNGSLMQTRLENANLREAILQDTVLFRAVLQGADMRSARLQGADLTDAELQGAYLKDAKLQGVDLGKAMLQSTDLTRANMKGADLSGASMQGAELRLANLQGADLSGANIQGAHFRGAKLQGADLAGAKIWQTTPPGGPPALMFANPSQINLTAPDAKAVKALRTMLENFESKAVRKIVKPHLVFVLNDKKRLVWKSSEFFKRWKSYMELPISSPADTSNFLAKLVCDDKNEGYIARGIAERASDYDSKTAMLLAKALLKDDCQGAKLLYDETRSGLQELADSKTKQ